MRLVVEPVGLMKIEGLEDVDYFPNMNVNEKKHGKVFLQHAGGEIEAPATSSMLRTAKKYCNGTRLKIKGREFKVSCSTLYHSESNKWKVEACINPMEQLGNCHCIVSVEFPFL